MYQVKPRMVSLVLMAHHYPKVRPDLLWDEGTSPTKHQPEIVSTWIPTAEHLPFLDIYLPCWVVSPFLRHALFFVLMRQL